MSTEISRVIKELKAIHDGNAWHGPSLRESLAGLQAEQAATRVIANAHNIWEIVRHISGWEDVFRSRLEGHFVSEPADGDFPTASEVSPEAWTAALAALDETHERLLKTIEGLPESSLNEKVADRDYNVRFMLRAIVRHHVYHTGQVALLRKALSVG